VAYWQRDLLGGEAVCTEAVRLAERMGDRHALAEALYNLSFPVWQQGRLDDASELAGRSQEIFTALGDSEGTARTLWLHGIVAAMTGKLDLAERLLTESVERHRGGAAVYYLGWSLRMLGRTLLLQKRPAEARVPIAESMRLFAAAGDVSAILLHLADYATIAALEDDPERELRLVGAVRQLRQLTGTDLVDHPVNAVPGLAELEARMGPDAEPLRAAGAAMTVDELVAYALGEPA
jgi:hypothetical protein